MPQKRRQNRRPLTLASRAALGLAALLALAAAKAPTAKPPAAKAGSTPPMHRVVVAPQSGAPLPYTIEVPDGWSFVQSPQTPGLWLGPSDAVPPNDPRLIYVRGSQVAMTEPEAVAKNIRQNDAAQATWSAPRVEVKDLGEVKGLLVRMDTGAGDNARSSLTLKLPLGAKGVDFVCQSSRADFEKRLPDYERYLLSVRLAPGAKP